MPSHRRGLALLALMLSACGAPHDERRAVGDTVVVFAASSLAAPVRLLLDSMARRTGAVMQEEHGPSLELARRVTELHRVPDVIALADHEVFPQILVPGAASWYARFARDRMVVAYTARSRHADSITAANWRTILLRDDVAVGRTDPELAPAGYRSLLMYELAERFYGEPGLATRLVARTPPTRLRANAADLAALLDAGELDYIVEYQSVARAHRFQFVTLPPEIDLGDGSRAALYATASTRVRRGRDSVTLRGAPILYGVSVPRAAPHRDAGARFVALMIGDEGRRLLRARQVDMLDRAELVGDSVPPVVRAALAP